MIIKKIKYPLDHEKHTKLIFQIQQENINIQFGTVFLKKGTRIPEKGFTKHDSHEVSIIQKGKIEMLNEDGSSKGYLQTGDVIYIKALEAQAGNVMEDTSLMYTLVK
jgi:quercetin dioxygenase-like cupin family protein